MGILDKALEFLKNAEKKGVEAKVAAQYFAENLSESQRRDLEKEIKQIKTAEAIQRAMVPYTMAGAAFAGGFLAGLEGLLKAAEEGELELSKAAEDISKLAMTAIAMAFPKIAQDVAETGAATPEAVAGVVPPEVNEIAAAVSNAPTDVPTDEVEEEEEKDELQKQLEDLQKALNELSAAQKPMGDVA